MKMIMRLMNRILPTCQEVSHLSSQALDESLPWRKRLGLRIHLLMCKWCRRYDGQLKFMRNVAHDHALQDIGQAKLNSEARQRIAEFLKHNDDQS